MDVFKLSWVTELKDRLDLKWVILKGNPHSNQTAAPFVFSVYTLTTSSDLIWFYRVWLWIYPYLQFSTEKDFSPLSSVYFMAWLDLSYVSVSPNRSSLVVWSITASFMTSPLCLMLLPALTTSQGFTFTITATMGHHHVFLIDLKPSDCWWTIRLVCDFLEA